MITGSGKQLMVNFIVETIKMNVAIDRTLEIKRELAELNESLKMSVQKAIKIGGLLIEQKEYVGHGNFLSWLEDNFEMGHDTAYRYIKLFNYSDKIPKIGNLQEAYQQIETIERQEKMSAEERKWTMISEYKKTGKKPEGWDRSLDYALQKEKEEQAKRDQRAKETIAQMKKEREEKESKKIEDDIFTQTVNMVTDKAISGIKKRIEWKEKIRLSDSGKDDAFNDAILDYLETLSDDNRRIEACNNIIKICRNISVELQKVKSA